MCGILGILSNIPPPEREVRRYLDPIKHRGPDSSGIKPIPKGFLSHARLAIVDQDRTGAQPMRCDISRNILCFNGEIYKKISL